uniref:Uncharacterized protein n=1 Tax=Chromera velia CCMP2878 TaxID=1169474 RepID=A0A0G4HGZ8_9ALVE|eukprot:Cvel_6813.t1-p1 / transcript=Cvel_6813.t1 / gene=Cvel_6813 / organism=Chromera_velia_CCMP2878 / gene_product=hypothetical protein / transcript_product=hypothetical protein / location=Cvel_scaffold343:43197-44933(-) / protein_length=579 / sequence_SO=supercontig / SO=protein_coding / is_pseudo=false
MEHAVSGHVVASGSSDRAKDFLCVKCGKVPGESSVKQLPCDTHLICGSCVDAFVSEQGDSSHSLTCPGEGCGEAFTPAFLKKPIPLIVNNLKKIHFACGNAPCAFTGTHDAVVAHDSPQNCDFYPDRQALSATGGHAAVAGCASEAARGCALSVLPNPAASYRSREELADWRPWNGEVSAEHLPAKLKDFVGPIQEVVTRLQKIEKSALVVIGQSVLTSSLKEHLGDSFVRSAQTRLAQLADNSLDKVSDELLSAESAAIVDVRTGRAVVEGVSAPLWRVEAGPWKIQGGARNQWAFALVCTIPEEVVVVVRKYKVQKDGSVLQWVSMYTSVYTSANPPSYLCAVGPGCVRRRPSEFSSDDETQQEQQLTRLSEDQCSSPEALLMLSTALSMYKYSDAKEFVSFIETNPSLPLDTAVTQRDREVLATWKELKKLCKRLKNQIADMQGKTALLGDRDQNRRIEHLLQSSRWHLAEEELRKRINTFRLRDAVPPSQYDVDRWKMEKLRCFHRMGACLLRQGKGEGGRGKGDRGREQSFGSKRHSPPEKNWEGMRTLTLQGQRPWWLPEQGSGRTCRECSCR